MAAPCKSRGQGGKLTLAAANTQIADEKQDLHRGD